MCARLMVLKQTLNLPTKAKNKFKIIVKMNTDKC